MKSLQVLECDGTCFEEVRDQEARRAAEEVQKITHQSAAKLALVDRGLEQLSVPDLLDAAQRALLLQPIDQRLHCGVRHAFVIRQTLEDLPYRTRAQFPVLLQDPGLGFRKTRAAHIYYTLKKCYYLVRRAANKGVGRV